VGKITRSVRPTLLIIGEGDTDTAFLKHLRALYCCDGAGVSATVKNAHGKGPEHIVDYTIKQIGAYNQRVAFLDTDILWTEPLTKKARKNKVAMVGSKPCFEGLLLSILGKTPPELSAQCKKEILKNISFDLTEWQKYAGHFPKTVLDNARTRLHELDQLLGFFEGRKIKT
jgi:hypothetical protein